MEQLIAETARQCAAREAHHVSDRLQAQVMEGLEQVIFKSQRGDGKGGKDRGQIVAHDDAAVVAEGGDGPRRAGRWRYRDAGAKSQAAKGVEDVSDDHRDAAEGAVAAGDVEEHSVED